MPKQTLLFAAQVFQESHELWRKLNRNRPDDADLLEKEAEHQQLIQELAKKPVMLNHVIDLIQDENEDIRREAFLVAVESKNEKVLDDLIQLEIDFSKYAHVDGRGGGSFKTAIYLPLLSDAAAKLFLDKLFVLWTDKRFNLFSDIDIIEHVAANQLIEYIGYFEDISSFGDFMQRHILGDLCCLDGFGSVLTESHAKNHDYFLDGYPMHAAIPFLIAGEETLGLQQLRKPSNIISDIAETNWFNGYANKSDSALMIKEIKEREPQEEDDYTVSRWIQGLASGGGNYDYVNLFLDLLKKNRYLVSLEICYQFKYFFLLTEDSEFYDNYVSITNALNSASYIESINELEPEERPLVDGAYIWNFWEKVYNKNKSKIDISRKIDMDEGGGYSLKRMLERVLYDGPNKSGLSLCEEYRRLITFTGQHFPLDTGGYYTKLKAHAQVWFDHLEANKGELEDGRWWRYGKRIG